jgi:hypothetical protein
MESHAMSVELGLRKPGRPATGKDPHMTARFPSELVATVEEWAARNDVSRSEAIRQLVQLGLDFAGYAHANSC